MGMLRVHTAVDYSHHDAATRATRNRRMVPPDPMSEGSCGGHGGQAPASTGLAEDASSSRRKSR